MNRGAFDPRTVLALVVFGAAAFLAMLWFIGRGDTGPGADNGQAHAASHGLTGYAALAALLEAQGRDVSLSRNKGRLDDEALLVLTPTMGTDADELAEAIERRRFKGPTLVILPKWFSIPLPRTAPGAQEGWVALGAPDAPPFTRRLDGDLKMDVRVEPGMADARWTGLGLSGSLPRNDARAIMALEDGPWSGLVRDARGSDLVAFADDGGCYPVLDAAGGYPGSEECEPDEWNVTVVFEPDLVNNWGMADRERAVLAARLVALTLEDQDLPIVFDLTFAGLGGTANLLTLAFTPPFLAATLCLLLALLVVGWRASGRFGAPAREGRAIAFGKARLAASAGSLVRRSGRLHLLGAPYTALIGRRIAAALGLRASDPDALDAALARRGADPVAYSDLARQIQSADGPSALLRAAHALHDLERNLRR